MKRLLLLMIAMALVPAAALAAQPPGYFTTDLIADGGTWFEDTGMWGVDQGSP